MVEPGRAPAGIDFGVIGDAFAVVVLKIEIGPGEAFVDGCIGHEVGGPYSKGSMMFFL